jgi:hypothetical protein
MTSRNGRHVSQFNRRPATTAPLGDDALAVAHHRYPPLEVVRGPVPRNSRPPPSGQIGDAANCPDSVPHLLEWAKALTTKVAWAFQGWLIKWLAR